MMVIGAMLRCFLAVRNAPRFCSNCNAQITDVYACNVSRCDEVTHMLRCKNPMSKRKQLVVVRRDEDYNF